MNEVPLRQSIARLIGIRVVISTIQVSSQTDAGTTVAVRLPARAAVAS
jgi:hypothetical protein